MARKKIDKKFEELPINNNHPHFEYYKHVEHCGHTKDGCLYYSNGDKYIVLIDGSIIIRKVIYKSDGNGDPEIYFLIEGITKDGVKLRDVTILASEFASLNWITKSWGTDLVVLGNQNAKQILSQSVLRASKQCEKEYVIASTGFIYDKNGKPTNYASGNGTVFPSDIRNELPGGLNTAYGMSGVSVNHTEQVEGIKALLLLPSAHVPEVTGPLFALIGLVAIIPIVTRICGSFGFFLLLYGKTQAGKSRIASLFMSAFGRFMPQTPPTTFASTSNAISYLANVLKDNLLWIDDLHPQADDMKRQYQICQNLSRMAGDMSERRRLDSNANLKKSFPPRCLTLGTAEMLPPIGQSGIARIFPVEVPKARNDLSEIDKLARKGILSRGMADYIAYTITNYDEVEARAKVKYEELLSNTNELFGECRLSNQAALLCLSADMFFDYAVRCKALATAAAEKYYRSIEASITHNARKAENQIHQEDPCTMYISAIRDLLSSGRASVINLCKKELPEEVQDYDYTSLYLGPERNGFIGWKDEKGYYLNTSASYSAVLRYYNQQDMSFVTNPNALWRQLRDEKYLIPDKNNTPCQNKKIGNRTMRVLWFPRKVFDVQDE